jgi:hypothetical protein
VSIGELRSTGQSLMPEGMEKQPTNLRDIAPTLGLIAAHHSPRNSRHAPRFLLPIPQTPPFPRHSKTLVLALASIGVSLTRASWPTMLDGRRLGT